MIPEDWEVWKLGEVVDFLDGQRRPVKDSDRAKMRGDFPYYGASGIVDYVDDFIFDEDLILLGEDGENILSRNCRLAFRVSGKVWVNNHAHVLRPRAGIDIGYLTEYLESLNYEQYNTGTAQPKLNKLVCSKIPILRPQHEEQRAIAVALSDVDALISAQDKLIAKKRDLKQAAMQQLLTGKKRLPGFSGVWEVKRLGDAFTVTAGGDYEPSKSSLIRDETYCYPIYSNSLSEKGLYGFCSYSDHEADSITVTARGTLGIANYRDHKFTAIGRVLVLEAKEPSDGRFFAEFINSRIDFVVESTGVPQLTAPQISKYELPVPSHSEQTAIATVLSDIDAEITALEQKRDKTRDLKHGMMQELLTGRTRLPLDEGMPCVA